MSQHGALTLADAVEPVLDNGTSNFAYYGSGGWAGQRVRLKKGRYLASFERSETKKNAKDGTKKMTYNLTFSEASPQPLKDLHGKFTIHSKRDGKSVRTNFKMHIDLNRDGKHTKEERLIKATKEGYKIKDSITKHTSEDYQTAKSLGSLSKSGYLSFEFVYRWDTPDVRFDELSNEKIENFFNADFSYWTSEPYPIF